MDSRQEKIRQDVLLDALVDLVNLAGVDARVKQHYQSVSDREVQSETLQTIRTLVNDGLIRVGYRGPDGQLVPEPLEKAMQEIHDAYISHYDEPGEWMGAASLVLTDKGRQIALSTEEGRRVAQHEEARRAANRHRQ